MTRRLSRSAYGLDQPMLVTARLAVPALASYQIVVAALFSYLI